MIHFSEFGGQQAAAANKLIDYFEGRQLNWVVRGLNGDVQGGYGFRYDWLKRGFVPRVRNIVKPIVEKSAGPLFIKQPKMTILPASSPTAEPVVDARLNELLMVADFQDFGQQWNYLSRLLRSVVILQQKVVGAPASTIDGIYRFDPANGDLLVETLLHRGNCVVRMNQTRTVITELAYLTENCPSEDEWEYRHITPTSDETVVIKGGKEVDRYPNVVDENGLSLGNPDGFVPAVMHYDTMKPQGSEVWHWVPEDISSFQELVNTHLTDLEFALATQKGQALFITDAEFSAAEDELAEPIGRAGAKSLPRKPKKGAAAAGIGAVVNLKSARGAENSPTIEYKGPDVDLAAQDNIVRQLSIDMASDWSVNLKVGGSGTASSGFQLVVEELDNLTLRQQRQVAFQASLRRMYSQLQLMYPELERGELQVEFAPVSLPVNQQEVEQVWEMKIAGGRASVIDYLMEQEGLSEAEAVLRKAKIDEARA